MRKRRLIIMAKAQVEKASMKELRGLVKEILVGLHTEAETGKKVTNADADFAVKAVGQAIFKTLESGNHAGITGVGTLELRERGERKGRNPQTGDELVIEARTSVGFNPSPALKTAVKGL
jgi:nucleoid DNA-binding protein